MPIAIRQFHDIPEAFSPLPGLAVRRELSASVMAALQGRSEQEMQRRFDAGHRSYVACRDGATAAWGWVATSSAEIGEVGSAFLIPPGERYLWNFVTLPAHRGLGIYPRLLDAVVRAELPEAERFWIVYAPENHASGRGIQKAGFRTVAELSFDSVGRAAVSGITADAAAIASRILGVAQSADQLAQCWRCARAGRGSMSCPPGECRCDYQLPASGCAA